MELPEVPVVLAHGFTQTSMCWGELGQAMGRTRHIVAPDLAGHGARSDDRTDIRGAADLLLADATSALGGHCRFDLLGYSMGARVALQAAIEHPGRIRRLVLLSGTAGILDGTARAERRRRDNELADALERSGDLVAFLDQWLSMPMFAGLDEKNAQVNARLANTPAGLASSLRLAGTGAQEPMWEGLGNLPCPVLALAGATDPRYCALAERLAMTAPASTWSMVPGAGHALHLERPQAVARIVDGWLNSP